MIVHIDQASPIPPYEQLGAQVAAAIVAGELAEGHQLPPIRQLARDLDVAPGTVARAYRELEASGLVRTDGRRGTRVAAAPAPRAERGGAAADDARLVAAALAFAKVAREVDVPLRDALVVAHAALASTPGIASA